MKKSGSMPSAPSIWRIVASVPVSMHVRMSARCAADLHLALRGALDAQEQGCHMQRDLLARRRVRAPAGSGMSYCGFAIRSSMSRPVALRRHVDGKEAADEAALLSCAASRDDRDCHPRGSRLFRVAVLPRIRRSRTSLWPSKTGIRCEHEVMVHQSRSVDSKTVFRLRTGAARSSRAKPWLAWIRARVYSFDACPERKAAAVVSSTASPCA